MNKLTGLGVPVVAAGTQFVVTGIPLSKEGQVKLAKKVIKSSARARRSYLKIPGIEGW